MKDHEFREYVNRMMEIFLVYGHTATSVTCTLSHVEIQNGY